MQFIKTFISLLVVFFMPFVADARTYLVSVGISDYPGTKMDLHLPAMMLRQSNIYIQRIW